MSLTQNNLAEYDGKCSFTWLFDRKLDWEYGVISLLIIALKKEKKKEKEVKLMYRICGVQSNSRKIPFSHFDSIHLHSPSPSLQISFRHKKNKKKKKLSKNSTLSDFTSTATYGYYAITRVSIT